MKPYHTIAIQDCGEALVPIPLDRFGAVQPHPYQALGAPYGGQSPYGLRVGVLAALEVAQGRLQRQYRGWRIQIFDAFRPVEVQKFMIEHTLQTLLRERQLQPANLSVSQRETLMAEVLQFWAWPSEDPATPPPHSTGAALDVTLVDNSGQPVAMGSPIDEVSSRSFPDFYAEGQTEEQRQFHTHRTALHQAMQAAGFRRHPQEWWHFSLGDQLWAWLQRQETGDRTLVARYGRVQLDSISGLGHRNSALVKG
ncbi:MAG: M15 family metallopeptidase [Nodosilinea sp.]